MKLNERNLLYYATCKSPVDKCGFLSKKGDRTSAYHKRWFVLKGNLLFYYDHEESKEPLGVIILEGCRVELCESTEEYAFAITFEHVKSRAYMLAADSQRSMESWVKALTKANFEYIRLVVMELQKQFAEVQKDPHVLAKPKGLSSVNPLNASSNNKSQILASNPQDWPMQKDNGCASWDKDQSDVCNGILNVSGLACQNNTESSSHVLGAAGCHKFTLPTVRPPDGSGRGQACSSGEEESEDFSFSQLHQLFGEEIVALRTNWTKNIQKTNPYDRELGQRPLTPFTLH
uniref:Sesquipedalian n=1 Tax=Leptobrachium leishanense TaxID=445787 RepID=A0A8C5MLX4_9ANUR